VAPADGRRLAGSCTRAATGVSCGIHYITLHYITLHAPLKRRVGTRSGANKRLIGRMFKAAHRLTKLACVSALDGFQKGSAAVVHSLITAA
jgi:hypothetical protein